MNRRTPLAVVAACGLLLGLSACSSEERVGSESLKNIVNQTGGPRLGEETASPTPKPVATKAPVKQPTQVTKTQAPPPPKPKPTPKQSAPAAVLKIDINGDNTTSTQFNPANAAAYTGTIVTWTNKDSVPRGVKASDGTFNSGPIAPGKTFSWTANKAGTIQYADSTRPYAVAQLTVQARG